MMMAMIAIRSAGELAAVPDPAWPEWLELVRLAPVPAVVLPVARQAGLEVLFRLQVTARSMMGALALNSGGMLADHGWVRLLGGGSEGRPDLAAANGLGPPGTSAPPPWLTIGFDALGGRFAVNGGGLDGFYQDLRWPGWQEEVAALGPDQGISVYPFLFTAQSHPIARASRRPVPFTELLGMHAEAEHQEDM
jgi:hypothetical protein